MGYIVNRENLLLLLFVIIGIFGYTLSNKEKKENNDCYIENIGADVPTFDPQKITDNVSWRVASDLFEGLVGYDQKGQIQMRGAESFEISQDGTVYTFYLRKDAKWSNGDPVTADDYVFSFQRALSPETLGDYYEQLLPIKNAEDIKNGLLDPEALGVEAVDDYILKIYINNPSREFIHYLTLFIAAPVYKKNVQKYGQAWCSKVETIVSNGAYKIVEWVPNGYVILNKNEYYWDKDKVKIDKVQFLMIQDVTADMNKFSTKGEHVSYHSLPDNTQEWYKKKYGEKYVCYNSLAQYKLAIDIKNEKFSDVRVRKALSMTVNREGIVKDILKIGVVSYSPILECMGNGFFKDIVKEVEEYDWTKLSFKERVNIAKKLLADAGYSIDNPLVFKLAFPTGKKKSLCEAIQTTWNTVFEGVVKCSLLFEDWKIFLENQSKGKYEICHADWMADYNLPSNFSVLYTTNNSYNFSRFSNVDVDNLYRESLVADSDGEYLEKQKELAKIIMVNYASIPYGGAQFTRLISEKIGGLDFSNNNLDRFSTKDIFFKK